MTTTLSGPKDKPKFSSSNVGNFFWSSILTDCTEVQERKEKGGGLAFTSSTKRENRHFHVVVMQ